MNTKRLLLTGCLIGSALVATGAFAQNVKPGQRMIYDNRMSEEPSQLDKPIFNKRIIAPKPAPEEPSAEAEGDTPEAPPQAEVDEQGNPSSDNVPETGNGNAADEPTLYVAPDQDGASEDESEAETTSLNRTSGTGEDPLGLDTMEPRKRKKLEDMAEDIARDMPHKNLTTEQIQNLSEADRERVQKDIQAHTDKAKEQLQKELAD
jgi:hypothetical protein